MRDDNQVSNIKKLLKIYAQKNGGTNFDYHTLLDDVNGFGTYLLYSGLKGKNIGIMGQAPCYSNIQNCSESYKWTVAFLSILCGVGVAVPFNKEWTLGELKVYANAVECDCVIFPKDVDDVVWRLYNDGVTPVQTFICMDNCDSDPQFRSMNEGIIEGKSLIAAGRDSFLNMEALDSDLAAIELEVRDSDAPILHKYTRDNIISKILND